MNKTPEIPHAKLESVVQAAVGKPAVEICKFKTGENNQNYLLKFDDNEKLVLRIMKSAKIAQKEISILNAISKSVPVPEMIYSDLSCDQFSFHFYISSFIDGISFKEAITNSDTQDLFKLMSNVGQCLAGISQTKWSSQVQEEGFFEMIERFVRTERFLQRAGDQRAHKILNLLDRYRAALTPLIQMSALVHCDFKGDNILISKDGTQKVVGVIDWEFAIANCPLYDITNFKRHLKALRKQDWQPLFDEFTAGYRSAGASLSGDWELHADLLDLIMPVHGLAMAEKFSLPNRNLDFLDEILEWTKYV